jgi:hypothetical protein
MAETKDERIAVSFQVSDRGEEYVQCWRRHCNHVMILRPSVYDESKFEYPFETVIVSWKGGTNRLPFCSTRCAAMYLIRVPEDWKPGYAANNTNSNGYSDDNRFHNVSNRY